VCAQLATVCAHALLVLMLLRPDVGGGGVAARAGGYTVAATVITRPRPRGLRSGALLGLGLKPEAPCAHTRCACCAAVRAVEWRRGCAGSNWAGEWCGVGQSRVIKHAHQAVPLAHPGAPTQLSHTRVPAVHGMSGQVFHLTQSFDHYKHSPHPPSQHHANALTDPCDLVALHAPHNTSSPNAFQCAGSALQAGTAPAQGQQLQHTSTAQHVAMRAPSARTRVFGSRGGR
jgi:hypothetical protein